MGSKKSKESDVYAFGMVIAEMLTRKTPFEDSPNLGNIIKRIMDGERPSRQDVLSDQAPRCWPELWNKAATCWKPECLSRPVIGNILQSLDAMNSI